MLYRQPGWPAVPPLSPRPYSGEFVAGPVAKSPTRIGWPSEVIERGAANGCPVRGSMRTN